MTTGDIETYDLNVLTFDLSGYFKFRFSTGQVRIRLIYIDIDVWKPVFGICEQQSRWPAYVSAQSEQCLYDSIIRKYHI